MQRGTQTDDRNTCILDMLTLRCRVATEEHLVALLRPESPTLRAIACRLRRLQQRGLIQRESVVVPQLAVARPITIWRPGLPEPNHDANAWQLQHRWARIGVTSRSVIWATHKAARLHGGCGGRLRQPLQVQHDLGVASVYIRRLALKPSQAIRWLGEDILRRRSFLDPSGKAADAAILNGDGKIKKAIEFGGMHYSAERLRRFHRHCRRHRLPYELW